MSGTVKKVGVEAVKALAAGERVALGHGLYARKNKDGTVSITLRKRIEGKAHSTDLPVIVLETVTSAALSNARAKAESVRKDAKDAPPKAAEPATDKPQAMPARATLQQVWDDYLATVDEGGKWSERNREANLHRVNLHFASWDLWTQPVADITATDLVRVLSPLRASTPHQCRKLVGLLNLTFIHAVGHAQRVASPMPDVVKLLSNSSKAAKVTHHPALTDWEPLRELVNAIRNLTGEASVRNALFLQLMTAQRTGEVIAAEWSEFDLDAGTWTIPRAKMKIKDRGHDHVIHLPTQVVAWLKTLPKGKGAFLFPGRMGADTVTSESVSKAMRVTLEMRDKHVPHGARAALKTLATGAMDEDERPLFASEWTEAVLDHLTGNAVNDAYMRGKLFQRGGKVLQWWADQLLA